MAHTLRFIDDSTGRDIVFADDSIAAEQVFVGNILTHKDESGRHHYQVRDAADFPAQPAHLVPARSNLKNVLILLGSLAATWFMLDWAFSYFS